MSVKLCHVFNFRHVKYQMLEWISGQILIQFWNVGLFLYHESRLEVIQIFYCEQKTIWPILNFMENGGK